MKLYNSSTASNPHVIRLSNGEKFLPQTIMEIAEDEAQKLMKLYPKVFILASSIDLTKSDIDSVAEKYSKLQSDYDKLSKENSELKAKKTAS